MVWGVAGSFLIASVQTSFLVGSSWASSCLGLALMQAVCRGKVLLPCRWSLCAGQAGTQLCFSSVQWLSPVWLIVTPWTAARQASLSITNPWSLLKLMSIELVMPSCHLILCHPLFLLPSIFPSIKVFITESALCIRWPKYWSFTFNISPSSTGLL